MMRGRLALSLVSLLLLPASAQVENTFAFTTLSCQRPPQGSPNHQVYASTTADRRCACIVPAEAASMSVYVRCRKFNPPHNYSKMKTMIFQPVLPMVTITVWLRVTRILENVLLAAILSTMSNPYKWGATNLLGSAELRGTECRKMNIAPGIETKVVPLSDCQQSDPLTGGPSAMPFLVAQQVRYLPVLWSAVYSLASESERLQLPLDPKRRPGRNPLYRPY
jgi:hypothetical protein